VANDSVNRLQPHPQMSVNATIRPPRGAAATRYNPCERLPAIYELTTARGVKSKNAPS